MTRINTDSTPVGANPRVRPFTDIPPLTDEYARLLVGALRYNKIIERLTGSSKEYSIHCSKDIYSHERRYDDTLKYLQMLALWIQYQNKICSNKAYIESFAKDLETLVPINECIHNYASLLRDVDMALNPQFDDREQRHIDAIRNTYALKITLDKSVSISVIRGQKNGDSNV
jgi:hypothetical protein